MASSEQRVRYRDSDFYQTLITFEVQDVLFRVPVEPFETRSEVFRDMFSLPSGNETPTEGTSDDSPIVLEGVVVEDFRALLKFLYPKKRTVTSTEFSKEEWIGIHALAFMWEFHEAKEASKAFLVAMDDSVTKFELAVRYEYDDWLRLAYKELTNRPDSLSLDEGQRIGLEATLNIGRVREIRWKSTAKLLVLNQGGWGYRCPQCGEAVERIAWSESLEQAVVDEISGRVAECNACRTFFYEQQTRRDGIIEGRVDHAIRNIVPEKILAFNTEESHNCQSDAHISTTDSSTTLGTTPTPTRKRKPKKFRRAIAVTAPSDSVVNNPEAPTIEFAET
ncbi:hypothetical protein SCHPADRAFT_558658 [Schizopora paradoxa]|uniref:BTB domain-containing protein n=1 Tax=Schizopora paradoxa TaxID=27342 RepID=A0A0H2RDL9_9AGAM|nr:hypothetical protein SCHPADRAFT_558658 [Schizopora paradoxa]